MWAEHIHARSDGQGAVPAAAGGNPYARRLHRAIALIFTATVAANFVVMAFGPPPLWITYAPLPPLLVLMASGLIMLVAPHLRRARGRRIKTGGAR